MHCAHTQAGPGLDSTRARQYQGSAVGWSGGTGDQGKGPHVHAAAGTGGSDGSRLLGATTLGVRAMDGSGKA